MCVIFIAEQQLSADPTRDTHVCGVCVCGKMPFHRRREPVFFAKKKNRIKNTRERDDHNICEYRVRVCVYNTFSYRYVHGASEGSNNIIILLNRYMRVLYSDVRKTLKKKINEKCDGYRDGHTP